MVGRALRRLASGVTVLTVRRAGLAHGATVSAVLPLSRKPPAIGACLRTSSIFTGMAVEEGFFSVNVLGAEQAALAVRFATAGRPPGDAQFAGLDRTSDRVTGAPLLRGCVANLSCRVSDCIRVGDHDMIIAEVIAGSAGVGGSLVTYTGRLTHAFIIPAPLRSKAQ
jgi:flavin reductase